MEALSEYLNYTTYLPLVITVFVLLRSWKEIGARWFLVLFFTVECIDLYSYQYSINWTTHYYGWSMLMSMLFFVPSFFRKTIASKLYSISRIDFFNKAMRLSFTQQEAALLFISFISIVAHLISYTEIYLYVYDIINQPYFRQFILSKLQVILHILTCFAILSFSIKQSEGNNHETART